MDKQRAHLEGDQQLTQDLQGAPCMNCPEGEYEAGTVTRTLEDGPTVLVVKEVPALVCDTCGDVAFSPEVSERLEELATEAAQDRTRSTGVESQVRHWPSGEAV